MSLIKESVLEEFSAWAKENADSNVFPNISEEEASYYIARDSEETYIMEYSFDTVAELKNLLEKYCGISADQQILKELAIEICQDRYRHRLKTHNNTNKVQGELEIEDTKTALPEFVYAF